MALTGTLETLLPIELVRNEMMVPLLATAAGMKWLPWIWTDAGLLGLLLPPRLSGTPLDPKMNSSESLSLRCWAWSG